jgi:L-ascorbate metabolism protein UlaG (beta-lactamase superfamily)
MKSFWPIDAKRRRLSVILCAFMVASLTAAPGAEPALTGDRVSTPEGDLIVHPVEHASLAMAWKGVVILVDPVGGASRYSQLPKPDLILITDIHPDHFDVKTLAGVAVEKTQLVAPALVAVDLPVELRQRCAILANQQHTNLCDIEILALPMYNRTPERLKFHPKGRGNGYLLTLGVKRVYLSGDTEDTPEMKALRNIDVAFVCMNLPYTMDVDQAAAAVREIRPKIVYPYHSRGSDLEKFKAIVGTDVGVEVRLLKWY